MSQHSREIEHPYGQRIVVLGSPGSGKSVFSEKLAATTGLPLVRLDDLYWHQNWRRTDDLEFEQLLRQTAARPRWILDGNYAKFLSPRLQRADTVVFLDTPPWVCLYRVAKRGLRRYLGERDSLPKRVQAGGDDHDRSAIDWRFVRKVVTFRKRVRGPLLQSVYGVENIKSVIVVDDGQSAADALGVTLIESEQRS